jgi:hypothetical protein
MPFLPSDVRYAPAGDLSIALVLRLFVAHDSYGDDRIVAIHQAGAAA